MAQNFMLLDNNEAIKIKNGLIWIIFNWLKIVI